MKPLSLLAKIGLSFMILFGCVACNEQEKRADGRITIEYWEKWTGFEKEAIKAIVDDFNASQSRIFVNLLSVSRIERKLLLATAGGNPPDVVGLWSHSIPNYAENNALLPLNGFAKENGIEASDYLDVFDLADALKRYDNPASEVFAIIHTICQLSRSDSAYEILFSLPVQHTVYLSHVCDRHAHQ